MRVMKNIAVKLLVSFILTYVVHAILYVSVSNYQNWFLSHGTSWNFIATYWFWVPWVAILSLSVFGTFLSSLKILFDISTGVIE